MNARFMIKANVEDYFEYTTTVFADSVIVVMRRASKLRGWDVFLSTFRWEVWVGMLLTVSQPQLIDFNVNFPRK